MMAKANPPNRSTRVNFVGLDGSRGLRAGHNHAKTGAEMITRIGCTDWNQAAGNSYPKIWRFVLRSPDKLSEEPDCSKDAQKIAAAAKSTKMATARLRSSTDHR